MRALLYGIQPPRVPQPDTDNPLVAALARTPMDLVEMPDPDFLLPDWVITKPLLTGVCGSDSKQVFMDFGEMNMDNPMRDFSSMPQVLGHEVVAEVVALGPEAEGVEIGDRVVLNPWLSCVPRGVSPICPACEAGELSLCWNFTAPPIAPGIHIGTSKDASGGYATLMPAHPTQLFPVPDNLPDELAVFADPFAVSLHAITRHAPPAGGRVLVYGAGALGTCAVAILRALFPDVEVGVVARFESQGELARKLGASAVFPHSPVKEMIELAAEWSGGVLRGDHDLPMAYPGGIDVVYDTISKKESLEASVALLKAHGTLVKAGVHGPTSWEWTPLYFKEISWVGSNAFGLEEVDGVRQHGIHHYLDLASSGRVDLSDMLTHKFALDDWRAAFTALATQEDSGAIKIAFDQRGMSTTAVHPLDMVTPDEIRLAVEIVRADPRFEAASVFAHVRLYEPAKDAAPDAVEREIEALLVPPGARLEAIEVVVSLTAREIRSWTVSEGARPALLFGESLQAMLGVQEHPDWQAALRRRGIEDFSQVQIDPWPAGSFGVAHEDGRRISRCIAYLRETPSDNGYARPIEGLIAFFDQGAGEVLEVVDLGVVPMPPERGSYLPADVGPMRDDLRPLEIVQPDGASFHVDGNHVRWQRWSFRVGFDPYEGLTLHTVGYHDGDRLRPVLHRASVCEMVVPYGDPGAMHGWKNAFDAGEWGLGRMANSLKLGCDCLGVVQYFDAVLTTEQGEPYTVEHAICLHEEDYGILWKHQDQRGGTDEVRRSRRLVVSFVATVGNYEYGFYWYFYLDGNIQLEVKLTGIVSTMAITPGDQPDFANVIAPGLAAPHHQHLFSARLDVDVDGAANSVYEVEAEPVAAGPENPWGNAFAQTATRLDTELGAQRDTNAATSRVWKVVNPTSRNGLGQAVGYKLVPTMSTPTMLASPESSVGRRAGFARHNLWVTPYRRDERRAAGEYPNQHEGGDGLPRWTATDRPVTDTDVVLWYTFGVTHFVRPEDWPVMPVEYTGFLLSPVGFFDRNPSLDVPPPSADGSCHADANGARAPESAS